jgi:hypothetical protein
MSSSENYRISNVVQYEICGTEEIYSNPEIIFSIEYHFIKIKWLICCSTDDLLEKWKSIRKAIKTNKKSELCYEVGGSSYVCNCENNEFKIEFIINNFEKNESGLILSLPCDIIKPCIDEIILVNEYARRNEKYPNSVMLENKFYLEISN